MTDAFTIALHTFEQDYHQLLQIAEAYPLELQTQPGVCGEWSAREVLAHLAGWLAEAKRRFPRYALGTGDMQYDVDGFNRVSVRMRHGMSYRQILEEVHALYCDLLMMARELAPIYIERDGRYHTWLHNLAREAREHGQQLAHFMREVSQ